MKKNGAATGRAIIYVFTVDPKNCDALLQQLIEGSRHISKHVEGFIESRISVSDDHTSVISHIEWDSKHAWSQAQWDETVQEDLVSSYKLAKKMDLKFYTRRSIIKRDA